MANPERIYKIHPAIGIARVGDADRSDLKNDFYFIGPEHPDQPVNADNSGNPASFKVNGKIKPQAARFRIFEYEKNKNGKFYPIGEVRTDDATRKVAITWRVELANRKAFFCKFHGQAGALDVPLFSKSYSNKPNKGFGVRNAGITGRANREDKLCLKPKAQEISAGDTKSVKQFTVTAPAEIAAQIPTLGELRCDPQGYLKVIGGYGNAAHYGNPLLGHFANNDGWFDSVSDGPVDAKLTIDGKTFDVEGGWVIVGPPDFAPAVPSYRTMYDTLVDIVVREMAIPSEDGLFAYNGPLEYIAKMHTAWMNHEFETLDLKSFTPEFTRDILPILNSIAKMWRVTAYRFAEEEKDQKGESVPGKTTRGGPFSGDFHPYLSGLGLNQLGGPGSSDALRMDVFKRVRDPNKVGDDNKSKLIPGEMPSTYGDYYEAANNRPPKSSEYLHAVSRLQYALLKAWAQGKFKEDWGSAPSSSPGINPDTLDRAALASVSGGAFYPGMEASWLLARREVFSSPFRIRRKPELDKTGKPVVLGLIPVPGEANPALLEFGPGLFTQQMAVPWQADFRECEAGFEVDADIPGKLQMRRIAWWPANRPDDVFPQDTPKSRKPWARLLATENDPASERPFWDADENDKDAHFRDMVELWSTLGFVVEMKPDGTLTRDLFEIDSKPSFSQHRREKLIAAVADGPDKKADVPGQA